MPNKMALASGQKYLCIALVRAPSVFWEVFATSDVQVKDQNNYRPRLSCVEI